MSEGWTYRLDFQGQAIELTVGEMNIGRSRRADISINDPSVSRIHAKLHIGDGVVRVEDLESSNGTFVNGLRLADPVPARQGSTLALGDAELTVHIEALTFRTVQMSAADLAQVPGLPSVGEATSLLQAGSVELAQQVLDQDSAQAAAELPPVLDTVPPLPSLEKEAATPSVPSSFAAPPKPVAAVPPPPPVAPPSFEDPPSASFAAPAVAVAYPEPFGQGVAMPATSGDPDPDAEGALGTPLADPDQSQLLRTFDDIEAGIDGPPAAAEVAVAAAVPAAPVVAAAAPILAPPAGFWRRLGAVLIDAVWMVLLNVALLFGWNMAGGSGALEAFVPGLAVFVPALVGFAISLVIVVGWATVGTTPGKKLLGLTVRTLDGRAGVGFGRALLRYVTYPTLIVGCFLIAFSSTKRGLHDLIAGTYVAR